MSYDTHRTWYYQIVGRNIHLWQLVDSGRTDTVSGYKIFLPGEVYSKTLVYPDESITDGLRFEGTAFIKPFVTVDPNELDSGSNPDLTAPSSVGETSHVNLSRMQSLAVVDYIKAMIADSNGNLDVKEYYMKEFWQKVSDHANNRRKTSLSSVSSPFAIR